MYPPTTALCFETMNEYDLKSALSKAADYFENRGLSDWQSEALNAIDKIENHDFSFVEDLWLKYAPTCVIDDLRISDAAPEDEDNANTLNDELAEIANSTFAILDRIKNEKT